MELKSSKIGVGARYLACIAATAVFAGAAYASGRELNEIAKAAELASEEALRNKTALLYLGATACSALGSLFSLIQTIRTYRMPKDTAIDKEKQEITYKGRVNQYAAIVDVKETRGPLEILTGCRTLKIRALGEKNGPKILRIKVPYQRRTRATDITQGTVTWEQLFSVRKLG